MSNAQYEEMMERRQHAYIADQLNISPEVLNEHPFEIEENASDDGLVYSWRVIWLDVPPPGVEASGSPGSQWSEMQPDNDDPDA